MLSKTWWLGDVEQYSLWNGGVLVPFEEKIRRFLRQDKKRAKESRRNFVMPEFLCSAFLSNLARCLART